MAFCRGNGGAKKKWDDRHEKPDLKTVKRWLHPGRLTWVHLRIHPWNFGKSSTPNHHDFRFKLFIFGSVIFWDFRLCLHQCLGWIQVGVSADFSILRLGFCLDSPFQKAWNLQSELRKLKTSIANCLNSGWFRGDPYETWIKICNAINKAFCCSHDLMHHDASCANLHIFESEDMSSWFRKAPYTAF